MEEIPPNPNLIENEPSETPKPALFWMVLIVVAFVLGMGAGYLIWARPQETRAISAEKTAVAALNQVSQANQSAQQAATQQAADPNQVQVPQNVKRYDVPIGNSPVEGSASAPITIIEFSDYQCPFCQQWQQQVLPQIKDKYGDKVRLVYRNFPLYSIHPEAESASEAAECAGEQKKYWEYHDLLFSGQKDLGSTTYTDYAQSLGLNMDSFKKCVDEHRYQSTVKADFDYASQLGVRSTPTFFINGLAVVGAQPFEVFQQIIDLELSGKIPK